MKSFILFSIFTVFTLSSCLSEDVNNSCYEISGTPTTSVDGPTETTVGVPITLDVTYTVRSNCDSFYLFFEEISQGAKYYTVNVRYDGCDCELRNYSRTEPFEFVSQEVGSFALRFKTTNTTYVEHVVEVTE
ncbi:MAG: hypothetical protein ACOVLC_02980 [Flavobacterium sp.]